jgi:hypothetical protein
MKKDCIYIIMNSNGLYRVKYISDSFDNNEMFIGEVIANDDLNSEYKIGCIYNFYRLGFIEYKPTLSQIGGDHYTKNKIQPIEYILANKLDFCSGNIVKYITRYKDKNGLEDLEKAKHYIELLIKNYEVSKIVE